jgi:hypothetical protein
MRVFVYLPLLMLLLNVNLYAQTTYEILQAVDFFSINKLERGDWKRVLTETDIEGSPYLNDEFKEGTVFMTSKTKFVEMPLRYNIFNDQVEFRSDDGSLMVLSVPEVIEKVEFGETTLEKGEASLYSRPRVTFEDARKPGAYSEAKPPRFIKRPDEYYIRIGKEPAELISKKKDIEELFTEHEKEMQEFIRKNKININRPEDLIKVVQFYNSL